MLGSYIIFNILNVIIQTVKSIVTIKCNKWIAAIVNAVAYGLYTYIVVLTTSDLDLWFKIVITAGANLIGVFVVKYVEEKKRKDKLWKVEATFAHGNGFIAILKRWAELNKISFNYIDIEKYFVVNFFCHTQSESTLVKEFIKRFNGKYFVSETKIL